MQRGGGAMVPVSALGAAHGLPNMAQRKAALRRVKFDGDRHAIDAMRAAFILCGDPGLLVD